MTNEYGTSYFGVRDIRHAIADLKRFSDNQLNGILHTFSEQDQQYYAETMRKMVSRSKQLGFHVYVNPWGVGRVFGGEALSEFPSKNPEHTQRLSSGDRAPAGCFNSPRFQSFMSEWIRDAAKLEPDVIFWDEPHWYTSEWRLSGESDGAWTCTCKYCQEQFQESFDAPFPDTLSPEIVRFRKQTLGDFLERVMKQTRQHDIKNAVCLMPDSGENHFPEQWSRLASSDFLDVLATTPYWALHNREPEHFVRRWSNKIITLAEQFELTSQVWIQGFGLDGREQTLKKHKIAIKTVLDCNPDSLFIWGWDGCRTISSIAPDDPETIWSTFLKWCE